MATKSKRKSSDKKMDKNLDAKFKEYFLETERFGDEKITRVNAADAVEQYSCLFGANKNLYRIAASLIDGLKPGARRMIYSWWELENCPQNTNKDTLKKLKLIKVDKLASNTVNYHPHGGTSTEELIGRTGQYWNNNVMIITPHGNYGNMRGDEPGAGRYIMAKLSEYAIDCFFDDFELYSPPMKLGYDGENYEPEFLPAKYPHFLFNPQFSGIGYGLASNIPSFNVTEVLDATIKLLKNPDAKIFLVPDFPTGCDILDEGQFKEINKTGQSKITMRASSEINYVDNIIHITSLPINSSSKDVIRTIIALKDKKILDDVIGINDRTKEGVVDIDILLKPDSKPDKVLETLYKKNTGLKVTMPVGITLIDDYEEYEYGIKEALLFWIDYRIDIVRTMLLNKYQILYSKLHTNEVLLMVFNKDNIDKTISIARKSSSRRETIQSYMKTFGISSLQSEIIADMHVYNFNKDSYERYKQDREEILKEITEVDEILKSDDKIIDFIIKQQEEGKKKWGRPRMSKVVKENDDNNDNTPNTEHLVGITESGYIKKLKYTKDVTIGTIGKSNSGITVLKINNRENILVIDSTGKVVKIPVSGIPIVDFEDNGIELRKFFSVSGDIKAVMELPSMDILNVKEENFGIIFITKKGLAKRVQISEFKKITDFKSGISLNSNDEVAAALFSLNNTNKEILISTNFGNGIRLPIEEIRNSSSSAKGVSMITLADGEEVVNASMINPKKKLLFFITSSGRVKVTELKYLPTMKRRDNSVSLISLVNNETLIGVSSVDKNDTVSVYRKNGSPDYLEIKSIEIGTRISKGEKMIKTGRGDIVVAYKVFSSK